MNRCSTSAGTGVRRWVIWKVKVWLCAWNSKYDIYGCIDVSLRRISISLALCFKISSHLFFQCYFQFRLAFSFTGASALVATVVVNSAILQVLRYFACGLPPKCLRLKYTVSSGQGSICSWRLNHERSYGVTPVISLRLCFHLWTGLMPFGKSHRVVLVPLIIFCS